MTISDEAKEQVAQVLKLGDTAVDATMGNGWDTLFLAERVGSEGAVFAFDVQRSALTATEKRLRKVGLLGNCELLLRGHEEMQAVVPAGVGAIMFNLGYLPYADREIVTRPDTTLKALQAAISLLRVGGILSVICYRGHPSGQEEAKEVLHWGRSQGAAFCVQSPDELPSGESPFLLTLQRIKE